MSVPSLSSGSAGQPWYHCLPYQWNYRRAAFPCQVVSQPTLYYILVHMALALTKLSRRSHVAQATTLLRSYSDCTSGIASS